MKKYMENHTISLNTDVNTAYSIKKVRTLQYLWYSFQFEFSDASEFQVPQYLLSENTSGNNNTSINKIKYF